MSSTPDPHREEIETRGYTVLEGVLDPVELELARAALDRVFRDEERLAPRRGWGSGSWRIAYMLPLKDRSFLAFCQCGPVLGLVRSLLGDGCVVGAVNGFEMLAGGGDQELHRDQEEAVPGVVLGVNALFALDDFRVETGCTRFVPESQHAGAHGPPTARTRDLLAVHVEAPAGSVIAFDGAMLHGGGANRGPGRRRAIHVYFTREWMRPHWDFPASLGASAGRRLAPAERRLLGFESGPLVYDPVAHRIRRGGRLPALARARSLVRRWILGD